MQSLLLTKEWALLLMLTIPVITSVDLNYCKDGYAAMRQLTPPRYRGLMLQARKVYQLCENTFHTLSYNRVCGTVYPFVDCRVDYSQDTTMGAVLQNYAEMAERSWAGSWVNNYESFSPQIGPGPGDDNMDPLIASRLSSLEGHFNSTVEQLVIEAKLFLGQMSNMIETPAFKKAIDGLTCHFDGTNTNMTDILTMAKQKFNAHKEESSEERTHFVKEVLYEYATKKLLQTVADVLEHFKPDVKKIIDMSNKLYGGENPRLEHLILRILEEMQTDRFLQRIDLLFKDVCQKRRAFSRSLLQTAVENLDHMLSMHSLFSFKQVFEFLVFTDDWKFASWDFEPVGKKVSTGLDAIGRKLKDGKLEKQIVAFVKNFLFLSDCHPRYECEEILLENKLYAIGYNVFIYIVNLNKYFEYLKRVEMNHGSPFLSLSFN